MPANEWTTTKHALCYLARADAIPHRAEGEGVLLEHVPVAARRILDLGTGDGRLLALLRIDRPESQAIGLDVSEPMLDAAGQRFSGDELVELCRHDMALALPDLGSFDAIVSCFAIHHLEHERKRSLFAEVFERLEPGGIFANLEHVSSPTERLHRRFYEALGYGPDWEDPSNRLMDTETQLRWLRETGFEDVDCYWKWLEMALLIGLKPGRATA
jgi:tRNA (cmo5U34)-methyltransferase